MGLNAALLTSNKGDWQTPPTLIERIKKHFDAIWIDPCASSSGQHFAAENFTESDDGLDRSWVAPGVTYVNPPYGRGIESWVKKIHHEANDDAEIIALLPSRTGARWFRYVWTANAVCFWRGRFRFVGAEYSAPFDSVLAYWGKRGDVFANAFAADGKIIWGRER